MTKRQRSNPGPRPAPGRGLRGEGFPALRAFLKGYLHQDFAVVHGSMRAAAEAFRADASPDERDQLVRELESLSKLAAGRKVRALRGFMGGEMGSGWIPRSTEEILELLEALRG